jgi:hypothetical protein
VPSTINLRWRWPSTSEIFNMRTCPWRNQEGKANAKRREWQVLLFSVPIRNWLPGVETVNGALTLMLNASGVVLGIDAEFFHSGEKSSAVDAHASGGSIGTAHAPLRFSERAHDRVPLFLHTLIGHGAVSV